MIASISMLAIGDVLREMSLSAYALGRLDQPQAWRPDFARQSAGLYAGRCNPKQIFPG